MEETVLREQLVEMLRGGEAHIKAEAALANVSPEFRSLRPAAEVHSIWEELEHLRIAQEDILRYTIDASWESPKWPDGFWPAHSEAVTDEEWTASVEGFLADLEEVITLVQDAKLDLTANIPQGRGGPTCARYFWWPITTPITSVRSCKRESSSGIGPANGAYTSSPKPVTS